MIDIIPQPNKSNDIQAEFNNAFAFLERLNNMETLIEINLMRWELRDCFAVLESYENELAFCFKSNEQEEIDKMKQKIIKYFNKYSQLGWGKSKGIAYAETGTVRILLIELNKCLRKIKYKAGMGMPKKGESKLF